MDSDPNIEYRYLENYKKFDVSEGAVIRPEDIDDCDALVMYSQRFTRHSATAGSRVALVARFGVGYDTVDVSACTEAGIALTITPDAVRRPVAASLLTLILAVTGKLLIKDRLTRAGPSGWREQMHHMGVGLAGRTLGLIGIGNIGAEAIRLIKPLDMKIIAHDPYVDPQKVKPLGVRLVELDDVFQEADVVAVACSLTDETYHLVNAERLALMKPTAFLVNIARGPIVDQDALVEALRAGRIAGAGLDVLEREPPDPDEPTFEFENVILSAHALSSTDQCMADCFAANVGAVLDVMHGREPGGLVNREILDNADWRRQLASYRERFGD